RPGVAARPAPRHARNRVLFAEPERIVDGGGDIAGHLAGAGAKMTDAAGRRQAPDPVRSHLGKPDRFIGSGDQRGGTARAIARAKLLDLSIWRDAPDLARFGLDEPHRPVGAALDVERIRVRRRYR